MQYLFEQTSSTNYHTNTSPLVKLTVLRLFHNFLVYVESIVSMTHAHYFLPLKEYGPVKMILKIDTRRSSFLVGLRVKITEINLHSLSFRLQTIDKSNLSERLDTWITTTYPIQSLCYYGITQTITNKMNYTRLTLNTSMMATRMIPP